jgi:hypothetical protein
MRSVPTARTLTWHSGWFVAGDNNPYEGLRDMALHTADIRGLREPMAAVVIDIPAELDSEDPHGIRAPRSERKGWRVERLATLRAREVEIRADGLVAQ